MRGQGSSITSTPVRAGVLERGWNFFLWPAEDSNGYPQGEVEIGMDHPWARMIAKLESQLVERLRSAGVEPIRDLDVCFAYSDSEQAGSMGINVLNRQQMVLRIHPDRAKNRADFFVQMFCHEYAHALFTRAFFESHSPDGVADFSTESLQLVDIKLAKNDTVASEALADAFALLIHRKAEISMKKMKLLTYEEVSTSSSYDDAYSLKRVLMRLVSDQSAREDNIVYRALRFHRTHPEWRLFECLERAVEEDKQVRSAGLSFKEIYEREVSADFDQVLSPLT